MQKKPSEEKLQRASFLVLHKYNLTKDGEVIFFRKGIWCLARIQRVKKKVTIFPILTYLHYVVLTIKLHNADITCSKDGVFHDKHYFIIKKTRLQKIANNLKGNIMYRKRHWVVKTVDWDKPLCIDSSIDTDSFGWSFTLSNYLFSMVFFTDFFRDMLII